MRKIKVKDSDIYALIFLTKSVDRHFPCSTTSIPATTCPTVSIVSSPSITTGKTFLVILHGKMTVSHPCSKLRTLSFNFMRMKNIESSRDSSPWIITVTSNPVISHRDLVDIHFPCSTTSIPTARSPTVFIVSSPSITTGETFLIVLHCKMTVSKMLCKLIANSDNMLRMNNIESPRDCSPWLITVTSTMNKSCIHGS